MKARALQYVLKIVLCLALPSPAATYTKAELREMVKAGVGNVLRETIDGEVVVESGFIPQWLEGNFMRHACGSFGDTDHMNTDLPNYINHLFDCLEIGNKFKIQNGKVTFTNKWYDTTVNDIYNLYGRNMNDSSVFQQGTFSKANQRQVDKWAANLSDSSKVTEVPHVSWWQIGNEAVAMTEMPIGVIIDPNTVTQKGRIQYRDQNLGFPEGSAYGFTNNPAHEHTEPDGTLWSAVGMTHFVSQTEIEIKRLVYKVGADKVRHVVGTFQYQNADLRKCQGMNRYPDLGARMGYLHSFCLTENYIILPEAGYMHDPCFYAHYDNYAPFFPQGFHFEQNGYTRLLVMRKSDGKFIANITLPPVFITHQLGSYEEDGMINLDMLTYNDASVYTRHTYLSAILGDDPYTTNVSRIRINMTDWSAKIYNLRDPKKPAAAFEMSNINYAFNGRKYRFGYMVRNFDQKEQNAITKINVDTGEEWEYVFPEGMYGQEPQFIPAPGALHEDDGVIISQGVDGRKHKAFMVVINARNMTLMGHVTAPDIALFGLHNRLFPLSVGSSGTIGILG